MKPFLRHRLARSVDRLGELEFLLSRPDIMADMGQFLALSREHTEVAAVAQRYQRYLQREKDRDDAQALCDNAGGDEDMAALAWEEVQAAQAELDELETELLRMLLPRDSDDTRPALLEIRAGTGGDESALFAADLLRMYLRYCDRRGWTANVVSESPSELGGYKEVVVRIESRNDAAPGVYGTLKFESGGHRVQRVPVTEAQGRIHTSACTVAVMAEPDEEQAIALQPSDLRIDTFRSSGAGGQHINKTDSAVRITHLPTGIVAECQDGRSQHSNKAQAMRVLVARIQEKERAQRAAKESAHRKSLVGSGDRSDRIRTYNFPQGRLTDHRINLTLYKLGDILDGDLDDVLSALLAYEAGNALAELELVGAA